uniref:Uncharacterized protein n=1 Tax=Arundo donax TaxID=35708 RepID=A0A0A9CY20_ARUDO
MAAISSYTFRFPSSAKTTSFLNHSRCESKSSLEIAAEVKSHSSIAA